jgi:hypothetical protein
MLAKRTGIRLKKAGLGWPFGQKAPFDRFSRTAPPDQCAAVILRDRDQPDSPPSDHYSGEEAEVRQCRLRGSVAISSVSSSRRLLVSLSRARPRHVVAVGENGAPKKTTASKTTIDNHCYQKNAKTKRARTERTARNDRDRIPRALKPASMVARSALNAIDASRPKPA